MDNKKNKAIYEDNQAIFDLNIESMRVCLYYQVYHVLIMYLILLFDHVELKSNVVYY